MENKKLGEFAFDLHTSLKEYSVPDFDSLPDIGRAAALAVHLRGLAEIKYEVLRHVSDFYFGIPSSLLKNALEILAEIEFVRLITEGRTYKSIIPNVPAFDDVYETVGDFANTSFDLNEHEQATLLILGELFEKPENKDRLFNNTNADKPVFDRCIDIGKAGGIITEHMARGKSIVVSPFYFGDNLEGLADVAACSGANEIKNVLDIIQKYQGWPLSLIEKATEIDGTPLTELHKQLILKLSSEGILKPPTIDFDGGKESFIFTPRPGNARLSAANREIYERAMALVASVRKGQLLAKKWRINSPLAILNALRNRGHLKGNSEADVQYKNLVVMKVGHLVPVGYGKHQFHLHPTEENKKALDLAITLLQTGNVGEEVRIDEEARIAFSKDEKYIQSIVSAEKLKKRNIEITDGRVTEEVGQLLLAFD